MVATQEVHAFRATTYVAAIPQEKHDVPEFPEGHPCFLRPSLSDAEGLRRKLTRLSLDTLRR
ncbi:MAG: hypothetical protein ABGZ53_08240 [Fuerstiella sp.]